MAVLGYLLKLKIGLGPASGAHFLHDFPINMFLIEYSISGHNFNVITFFLLKISNKMCFKFLFRTLMTSQALRFIFDQPLKQWLTGKKEGKKKIQKFEYLESEKSFLDEIKSIFHSFEGLSFGEK